MTFAIAVRTITRPVDYCTELLERINQYAARHVLGVCVSEGTGITPNENACRALERAARLGSDWVLFFEDDADFINDILGSTERWLTQYARPTIHVYPLGCNYNVGRDVNLYSWSSFYGSVGLVLRTSRVQEFVDTLRTHPAWMTRDPDGVVRRCLDLNLSRWHQRVEPDQTYTVTPGPCFINHLGKVSTIATEPGHFTGEYPDFAGREFTWPRT